MNIKRLLVLSGTVLSSLTLVWMCLFFLSGPPKLAHAAGDTYTVCPTGPCDYNVIQDAVDAASDGDVIKVAAGTYDDVNNYSGLAQILYINKSVTIRGGYTTVFTEPPDPEANPTTLDAGSKGRVIYIEGYISPTIAGLRITGGDATGLSGGGGDGQHGGGVYINASMVTVRNNNIFSNTAVNTGGGLFVNTGSSITLDDNIIKSNKAEHGGGLFLNDGSGTLNRNTIISNTANGEGGGLSLEYSEVTLTDNMVTSNESVFGGGVNLHHTTATLIGNTVISNTAEWGGGVDLTWQSDVTLTGNYIRFNTANQGGGLWMDHSDATLTNNVIADNQANVSGSAIFVFSASPNLLHNTIARNTGGDGSGLQIVNDGTDYSHITMTNTIVVSHTVGIFVEPGNTATLDGTLWGSKDGAWENINDWSGIINHNNDYWGEPDFVDYLAGDYHINEFSDAKENGIDAGVTTDMDNQPRPYQKPDIGADEYWPPGLPKYIFLPLTTK